MGKSARKAETQVPRKRLIAEAPKPPKKVQHFTLEVWAVLLLVAGIFLALALASELSRSGISFENAALNPQLNLMGPVGAAVAHELLLRLGYCSFVIVAWALMLARSVCLGWKPNVSNSALAFLIPILSSVAMLLATASIAAVLFGVSGGGTIGAKIGLRLVGYVNEAGALLLSATVFLLFLGLSTGFGAFSLFRACRSVARWLLGFTGDGAHTFRALVLGSLRIVFFPFRRSLHVMKAADAEDEEPFTLEGPAPVTKPKRRPRVSSPIEDDEDDDDLIALDAPVSVAVPRETPLRILRHASGIDEEATKKPGVRGKSDGKSADKPKAPIADFQLPSPEFLVRAESTRASSPKDKELIENSARLEQSMLNFKIGGQVVEVHPGPVITLYQFEPAPGVKVQRIIGLADDLALSLKVASVRVYAPVPGKGTVGIEVPNVHREIVRLRDLVETPEFADSQQQIALALGKDTFGDPFIADLAKMPHLLIAGATGTGKSVCINSLLLSLLYRNTPADLRLILIDPKMLELSVYEDIPHLKAPVVTLAKRARGVLWWAVEEMERRYTLMKETGVRNLASYNALVVAEDRRTRPSTTKAENKIIELQEKDVVSTSSDRAALDRENDDSATMRLKGDTVVEHLPHIVIVVDELADLMLTVGREIEELLTRLAQKARAAGIHLILATQRPSVNVITGLIKANFPSRISFKVASRIDARTVMDTSGAERLLGQGDMLFLSPGAGRAKRLHSPFVSDKEVHDVVAFIRSQGKPDYDARIESMIEKIEQADPTNEGPEEGGERKFDPLYDKIVGCVIQRGEASTSMVQRYFSIGYNRAARILDTMEAEGVVGPADGAKRRQVLVPHGGSEFHS